MVVVGGGHGTSEMAHAYAVVVVSGRVVVRVARVSAARTIARAIVTGGGGVVIDRDGVHAAIDPRHTVPVGVVRRGGVIVGGIRVHAPTAVGNDGERDITTSDPDPDEDCSKRARQVGRVEVAERR